MQDGRLPAARTPATVRAEAALTGRGAAGPFHGLIHTEKGRDSVPGG